MAQEALNYPRGYKIPHRMVVMRRCRRLVHMDAGGDDGDEDVGDDGGW